MQPKFASEVNEHVCVKKTGTAGAAKQQNCSVAFENANADAKAPVLPALLGRLSLTQSPPDSRDGTGENVVASSHSSRGTRGQDDCHSHHSSSKKACAENEDSDDASVQSTDFGYTTDGGDSLDAADEARVLAQRTRLAVFNRLARKDVRLRTSDGIV